MKLYQQRYTIALVSIFMFACNIYGMSNEKFAAALCAIMEESQRDNIRRADLRIYLEQEVHESTRAWLQDSTQDNCNRMSKALWIKAKFDNLSECGLSCDKTAETINLGVSDLEWDSVDGRDNWSRKAAEYLGYGAYSLQNTKK